MNHGPGSHSDLVGFSIDLTVEEARRRAEVVAALGPDWDPVAVMREEAAAHALLYSGLDEEQQRVHAMLVAAGVLPGEGPGRASSA
ncbi:DUF6400 family protein [Streptomyces sp. Qhu_M48]|uniref:DUF6400 family protein n=1 Tax=Streptomyces sp. Qhu_M48 TaxID=3435889 RepID=UPI003F508083